MDGSNFKRQAAERLGRIVSVSGVQVVLLLEERSTPGKHGGNAGSPQMGTLVKMYSGKKTVFGIVSGMSIPLPSPDSAASEMKIVELELLGECGAGGDHFRRGISIFPSIGEAVYATTSEDLERVYACPDVPTVPIGTIHQDQSLPAHIIIDDLLGKHFAVLGTTGSGKSCAVALILRSILERQPHAHMILLDPHNEYADCFGERAELLDPERLDLPFWLFNADEMTAVVSALAGGLRPEEAAILAEAITAAKVDYAKQEMECSRITADTPVPYYYADLIDYMKTAMGRLEKPEKIAPYQRLKGWLDNLMRDPRFGFMFRGTAKIDNMHEILSRIFRLPVDGRPLTIIDLSAVPSDILNVAVSVLARITFDFALWADREVPMLLVCEEAHRYAPADSNRGFEPTKQALARIAKEGRKYGVSLCVVSQRPCEMAAEVLSECNTIFALRMSNQQDQDFVGAALADSAMGLMAFLPSLRSREAIVVGEGVPVPLRLCFDALPEAHQPRSRTAAFSAVWGEDAKGSPLIDTVIQRWRGQRC